MVVDSSVLPELAVWFKVSFRRLLKKKLCEIKITRKEDQNDPFWPEEVYLGGFGSANCTVATPHVYPGLRRLDRSLGDPGLPPTGPPRGGRP